MEDPIKAMSFQPQDRKTHSMDRRRENPHVKVTTIEVWLTVE